MMKLKVYKQRKIVRDWVQGVQTNWSYQQLLVWDMIGLQHGRRLCSVHKLHLMIQMTQYCRCDAVKSTGQDRGTVSNSQTHLNTY